MQRQEFLPAPGETIAEILLRMSISSEPHYSTLAHWVTAACWISFLRKHSVAPDYSILSIIKTGTACMRDKWQNSLFLIHNGLMSVFFFSFNHTHVLYARISIINSGMKLGTCCYGKIANNRAMWWSRFTVSTPQIWIFPIALHPEVFHASDASICHELQFFIYILISPMLYLIGS